MTISRLLLHQSLAQVGLSKMADNWQAAFTPDHKICWLSTRRVVCVIYTSLHENTILYHVVTAIFFVWSPDDKKYESFTPYTQASYINAHWIMLPMFTHRITIQTHHKFTYILLEACFSNRCLFRITAHSCDSRCFWSQLVTCIFFLWRLEIR